ncbi:MAG: YciI family protein [Alphaproteobacteria bacterium]|nr:YciI family protein [Alphaproteobacteria bacterium]
MFVVLLHYLKPIEEVERVVVPHRAYLDQLYKDGVLLASGPQIPRTGGVLLAKGMDKEDLWELLHKDPFYTEGIADYKLIEFDPIKHNAVLKDIL